MPSSLRILVTGASGFVGQALVRELAGRGHHVVGTTTGDPGERSSLPGVSWVHWNALDAPLPQVDWSALNVVIHLAAPKNLFAFPDQAPAIFEVAVSATFRLLEQARVAGVPRVVLASTGDVLGPTEGPAREADRSYVPASFYGAAKGCSELLARAYEPVLSTAAVRIYHPYGPGGERFLINRLIARVMRREVVRIEGPEGILLNPVWNDDLAVAFALAAESAETGVFHAAGPDLLTLRAFLELTGEIVGCPPQIEELDRPCDQRHAGGFAETTARLGYLPRVDLREGIRRIAAEIATTEQEGACKN